jgi:predicted transposase/invertase (TIGR01784 family)
MKHPIDPKIDCVFKALLGAEENRNLLIHFLNAILENELKHPLTWVEILNPYNEKEFISDKLSIVDLKAKDDFNQTYQIEIQLKSFPSLPSRMIYNWADIYSKQIKQGDNYQLIKPTYSIWLLAEDLIENDNNYAHNYKLRDPQGQLLNEHGGIWLLELNKFNQQQIKNDEQRWLKFFKDGEQLDNQSLPKWMQTQEMRQAMNTLSVFSEKERQYDRYQARQEYLRIQNTIKFELEQERQEKEQAILREKAALQESKKERQEKEAALEELAQLKLLMQKQLK